MYGKDRFDSYQEQMFAFVELLRLMPGTPKGLRVHIRMVKWLIFTMDDQFAKLFMNDYNILSSEVSNNMSKQEVDACLLKHWESECASHVNQI